MDTDVSANDLDPAPFTLSGNISAAFSCHFLVVQILLPKFG